MDYRQLGKTGLRVSTLGFGCGAVGGLLVKGARGDMIAAVTRAIDAGINYFDTAALYGNGLSETNLGSVLSELKADVFVGTKVRLQAAELDDIEQAVFRSVEASLTRLGRDSVDLIQLHNSVAAQRRPERDWITPADVEVAMQAFQRLKEQGKVGHWGFNGLGETTALQQALAGNVQTVQSCYNLINPTAGMDLPVSYPYQDFQRLIDQASAAEIGVIAIRVLAGGALSGSATRHANAAQSVDPIASSQDFDGDVALARRFDFLIEQGYAATLVEAAIRFAIGNKAVATTLVGISNGAQ